MVSPVAGPDCTLRVESPIATILPMRAAALFLSLFASLTSAPALPAERYPEREVIQVLPPSAFDYCFSLNLRPGGLPAS